MRNILLLILLIASVAVGQTVKTYTELPMTMKILNPERGHDISGSTVPPWTALSAAELLTERNTDSLTIHYTVFDLTSYRDGHAISASDLNVIKQSLWAAHQAGMKLILRFTYCSSGCSGMSEAPIDSCVKHIAQVMSIVRDSAALVAMMNGGWMGAWGEWDYGYSTVRHWDTLLVPRQRIMDTMLAYLPSTRQYSIGQAYHIGNASFTRYGLAGFQWNWQTQVNGIPTDTLTLAQAWDSTNKRARVGFDIDGWLLGNNDGYNDDGGMYYVYPRCGHEPPCPSGTWDGATYADANYGKPWWNRNSRFYTNYGEVCGGSAGDIPAFNSTNWLEHGRDFHLTYFPFSPNTCYDWKTPVLSCWDTTFNKLGYRISVVNDTIPTSVNQGDTLTFKVTLKNRGWATPTNPRRIYGVLRKSSGGYVRLNAVQSWDWRNPMIPTAVYGQSNGSPAQHTFTFRAYINPATVPTGNYSVGIWAPDYYTELQSDSRYSIHFANVTDGNYNWEDSTGINNLGAIVQVASTGMGEAPSTPNLVSPKNDGVIQSTLLKVLWSSSIRASTYQLQIANNSQFLIPMVNDSTITDTSFQVSLSDSQENYYWHVRARNQWGTSPWSTVSMFSVSAKVVIQLSPDSVSFGKVAINTTKTDSIILYNTSANSSLFVKCVTSSPFIVQSGTLEIPSLQSAPLYISFHPTQKSNYSGIVVVADTVRSIFDSIKVNGTGVSPVKIRKPPIRLSFSSVQVGVPQKKSFTVYNDGDHDLFISGTVPGISIITVKPTSGTIAPHDSLMFQVTAIFDSPQQMDKYIHLEYNHAQSPDSLFIEITDARSIEDGPTNQPSQFKLYSNYPNPFNPSTMIRYQAPVESKISLKIYNILGQVVQDLVEEVQPAGYKSVRWDAVNFPDGVYFYCLEATAIKAPSETFTQVKKMLLIK